MQICLQTLNSLTELESFPREMLRGTWLSIPKRALSREGRCFLENLKYQRAFNKLCSCPKLDIINRFHFRVLLGSCGTAIAIQLWNIPYLLPKIPSLFSCIFLERKVKNTIVIKRSFFLNASCLQPVCWKKCRVGLKPRQL